jgi:hypothetical protein
MSSDNEVILPQQKLLDRFEYLRKYIDEEKWDNEIGDLRAEGIGKSDVDTYIIRMLDEYEGLHYIGGRLWSYFHEHFEGWTDRIFSKASIQVRNELRDFLTYNGVFVVRDRTSSIGVRLTTVLQEEQPYKWTEEDMQVQNDYGGGFNPKWNPFPKIPVPSTSPERRQMHSPPIRQVQSRLSTPRNPREAIVPQIIQRELQEDVRATSPIREPSPYRLCQNQVQEPLFQTSDPNVNMYPPGRPYMLLPPEGFARQLTDLGKLYSDSEKKFGGELFDILAIKLLIFYDLCGKAGLSKNQYHNAYSLMLKGRASTFYYESLANRNLTFEQMIQRTKGAFETQANKQEYLKLWKTYSFKQVLLENTDKRKLECLHLLVDKLRRIQPGLSSVYQSDESIRSQLISACSEIPECELALFNPAPTFEGVYAQLRNAIYTRGEQAGSRQFLTENEEFEPEQLWTDRRYNGRGRFSNRGNSRRGSPFRRTTSSKFTTLRAKTCYICRQPGCWSTNHPDEERQQAFSRFKSASHWQNRLSDATPTRFQAFLAEWEGVKGITDSEMNQVDQLLAELEIAEEEEAETYLTEFGYIDPQRAISVLNDQAILHAITKHKIGDNSTFIITSRYSSSEFHGIMPDTGASGVSTAGEPQVRALRKIDKSIQLDINRAGEHNIKFGIGNGTSIGTIDVPTPLGTITFHVVPANTPFLLCVQDMDKMGVHLDNVRNVLVQGTKVVPVIRKFGHPFMLLHHQERGIASCHLTETELRQLHRRFGHPSIRRLAKILQRSGHDFNTQILQQIQKFCHYCQMNEKAPGRFKFTLKDDCDFNYTVIIDVMYLEERQTLHVVDEATSFQAARFLENLSAKTTWETLRNCWIDVYLGPPDRIVHDAGTNFASKEFRSNAKAMSIQVHEVPVEAHNSVGKVERYHAPLRRAYRILKAELNGVNDETILQMAVKAVNDSAGPDGLVPTLLVFGAYPRMADESPASTSVQARGEAVRKAMREVQKIHAERQVADALATRNGPNPLPTLKLPLQSKVRVWREKHGWTGPYTLLAINGQECTIEMPYGPTNFRSTVVKPYHQHQDQPTQSPEREDPNTSDGEYIEVQTPLPPSMPIRRGRGRPRGSKNKPRNEAMFEEMIDPGHTDDNSKYELFVDMDVEAFLTAKEEADLELATKLRKSGIIKTPGMPFQESDRLEITSLIKAGVLDICKFNSALHGSTRIFNSRMVREVKGKTTDAPYEKSRLVIQAYNDEGKAEILTQSPTIQRASQRLIVMLAPTMLQMQDRNMFMWLRDITQAYTQSESVLKRLVCANLPKELCSQYPEGYIMVVLKPLYGVPEAGTHWFATYHKHHIEKLAMTTSTYDPCLLVTKTGKPFGLVGMQTDDTLILAEQKFAAQEEAELIFAAKPKEQLTTTTPLMFNGCILSLNSDGTMDLRQKGQGKKIELINPKSEEEERRQSYVQQRARGAYIATICQPEASFDLSVAAQHQSPSDADITALNKRLEWQQKSLDRGLKSIVLTDLGSARLYVFVDGSFANNSDLSSQLGFIILLANENIDEDHKFTVRGNIIHYTSVKSKRITRSVLASEIYGMVAGVDMAYAISTTLRMITNQLNLPTIPTIVCTDSYSLYECLVKLGTTKEKRLMIDIMALRESYERRELYEIRWINGLDNPADAMTKANPNHALQTLIDTNSLLVRVEGWVKRD